MSFVELQGPIFWIVLRTIYGVKPSRFNTLSICSFACLGFSRTSRELGNVMFLEFYDLLIIPHAIWAYKSLSRLKETGENWRGR